VKFQNIIWVIEATDVESAAHKLAFTNYREDEDGKKH